MSDAPTGEASPPPETPPTLPEEQEVQPNDTDDYAEAGRSTADFIQNIKPVQEAKKKRRKHRFVWLVLVLLLAGGGAAAYFFVLKPEKKQENNQPTQNTGPVVSEDTADAPTERYVSQSLKLAFDHPNTWKAAQIDGKVQADSPVVKLKNANGEEKTGKIVLSILPASVPLGQYDPDAKAARDSEKLAYAAPSPNQRQETFLSFIGFGGDGLDVLYITGDAGYKKGDSIPKSDIIKIQPIVEVKFYECESNACDGTGSGPLTVSTEEWGANKNLQAVHNILKSLTID